MKLKNYSDIELLELLRGDKKLRDEAFNEIYTRYSRIIHGYIYSLIKDSDVVEDVFQETFVKFYDYALKYEIKNIQAFLLLSSKNRCLNYFKNKKHNIEIREDILSENNIDEIEKNELMELIISSLDLLDDIYRECFTMREFEGLTYSEIADRLGITTENAKVRSLRAKRKIIELLQPYLKDLSK